METENNKFSQVDKILCFLAQMGGQNYCVGGRYFRLNNFKLISQIFTVSFCILMGLTLLDSYKILQLNVFSGVLLILTLLTLGWLFFRGKIERVEQTTAEGVESNAQVSSPSFQKRVVNSIISGFVTAAIVTLCVAPQLATIGDTDVAVQLSIPKIVTIFGIVMTLVVMLSFCIRR